MGLAEPGDVLALKPRVLLVDDNEDAVRSLARLLAVLKYPVKAATSGPDALTIGAQLKPQVVVLDLGMPGMDGFETARAIRATDWGAKARLIALTGWGSDDDKRRTAAGGFEAHLVKPLQIQDLIDLLG